MADGEYFYLAASWADETESIYKNRLKFDGNRWSKAEDEDHIVFLFDMGQTAEGANCQAFCHFPGMHTNGGLVDVWNWKAARTNPMGYSEDTYWDGLGQNPDDGVSSILVNDLDASRIPGFMASSDPGAIRDFLVENTAAMEAFDPFGTQGAHTVDEAVSFDNTASFNADATLPGYVLRIPSGDVADVQAAGKYADGVWTVEFKRAYAGSDQDFKVERGTTVQFMHDIFDNQGSDHAIDGTPIDTTIYTLDFSNIAITSVEPYDRETPSSFLLKQNYPNPFNPATNIEFNIAQAGPIRLEVFNSLGQSVAVLVDEEMPPGQYRVRFDARSLVSGVYFYTLTTSGYTQTRRMALLK